MRKSLRTQQVHAVMNRPRNIVPVNPRGMPMDIDLGPKVRLRWVRRYFNGAEQDTEALGERRNAGWVPVDPKEIPEKYQYLSRDGMVQRKGCVLCKIDADIAASHTAFAENKALGLIEGARSVFEEGEADSRMPRFSNAEQKVIRGKRQ